MYVYVYLLSTLGKIDYKLIETNESSETPLFDNSFFDLERNPLILSVSINYILSTERFQEPLI